MSTLKTNYTDDVFSGNRKYNMITNDDGTVSFVDVTVYSTEGDSFGASDINAINTEVNNSFKKTEDISAIGLGSAAKKNVVTSVTSGGGDVQTLTMGDLRAMKGTQRAFFENQWIFIVGVDESGYDDVTAEDIYKNLMVTQYYKNILDPDNYIEIFSWEPQRIKETISMMSDGAKMNLVVAANTCIEDGTLDSLRKIQVLEECLGCELTKP